MGKVLTVEEVEKLKEDIKHSLNFIYYDDVVALFDEALESRSEDETRVSIPLKVGDTLWKVSLDDGEIKMADVKFITIAEDEIYLEEEAYDGLICTLNNLKNAEVTFDNCKVFKSEDDAYQFKIANFGL